MNSNPDYVNKTEYFKYEIEQHMSMLKSRNAKSNIYKWKTLTLIRKDIKVQN